MRRYALVALVVILAGCGGGCPKRATAEFLASLEAILDDWDDTNALANGTQRIALAPVLESLQRIKREVADLEAPCEEAQALQDATVEYMELTVDGYLLFVVQDIDDVPGLTVDGYLLFVARGADKDIRTKFEGAAVALHESVRLWSELSPAE